MIDPSSTEPRTTATDIAALAQTPLPLAAEPQPDTGSRGGAHAASPGHGPAAHAPGPAAHASRLTATGMLFNVIIPVLILAAGAGFVVALGTSEPEGRDEDDQTFAGRLRRLPAAEVTRVLSMEEIGKPLELRVDGVVVPFREVQLAAEVSGRMIEKSEFFRAGNFVTQGQLLCRIDPTDYEQEVLRLTRVREQDYEALKEIDQEIANTKLMLDIAKQDVELAQREVIRLQSLPRGFVSESELDQAQKALLSSRQSRVTMESQASL